MLELNKYIDLTKLEANVSKTQIDQLIEEAKNIISKVFVLTQFG